MKVFIIASLVLFLSCSSTENIRRSEISVDYEGQNVLRSGGFYKDESFINRALLDVTRPHRVIFSNPGCQPCIKLMHYLKEKKLMHKVMVINTNDLWVRQISGMMGISQTPTMVVVEEGKGDLRFEGVGQIITHLIRL
ncbi:MAG: hypothetical protein HOJ16_00200 [Candidatus Peribacter sp.]|jgi:hypothetical protein|nr:hypothetical protein [Candidatus Peribacter sp.]